MEKEEITIDGVSTGLQKECTDYELTEPFNPKDIKISQKIISLDQIVSRMKNGTIRLSPDFQRNEVWDNKKKSLLIESLLLSIPIPMFYVAADEDGNWDVVDGLQRLSALRDFIITKTLVLKKLEFWKEYDGKTFDDLSPILYNRINETQLYITIIEPNSPPEVKFNIFKRINTGGVGLSSQEIRHALYQGVGTEFLKRMADSEAFLKATTRSINDKRMSAREVILRCLSFMIMGTNGYYNNDNMETFLNRGIQVLNNLQNKERLLSLKVFSEKKIPDLNIKEYEDLEKRFCLSMKRNNLMFGDNAFRISTQNEKRSPVNKALFDVWGTVFSEISDEAFNSILGKKNDFLKEYDGLKKEEKFYNAVSTTAWQKNNVEYRFYEINKLIGKYI